MRDCTCFGKAIFDSRFDERQPRPLTPTLSSNSFLETHDTSTADYANQQF